METIPFNSSTHRIVIYKGNPVTLPLMTYWKLSDMKPDDTVIIQQTTFEIPNELGIKKVKVSELSEFTG